MKKLIITSVLFIGLSVNGFAQSDKINETAKEKVEELNAEIIAGDNSKGLTEEQKSQIIAIHLDRLNELKVAKKNEVEKEVVKEINKKHFKKIHKEILTKEQSKARVKGKKEKSEKVEE